MLVLCGVLTGVVSFFITAGGYLTGGLQDPNVPCKTETLKMTKVCSPFYSSLSSSSPRVGAHSLLFVPDDAVSYGFLRLDGYWRGTVRTSGKNPFLF